MCLGSARTSDVPLLDRTVTVGYEEAEPTCFTMDEEKNKQPTTNDTKKRKVVSSSSDSETDASNVQSGGSSDAAFAHFLVVEPAQETKPINFSIFAIQKLLLCSVGNVKSAKKLRNGSVLVEVASRAQYLKAMQLTMWVDTPIKVSAHRSLNSSRGVIRCREFRDCDDNEVLEALRFEGVTSLKHILKKIDGNTLPTNTFILTFSTPTPPKFVRAAYMQIPVEPFIPNPLRCFNCQKFGHGRNQCNRRAVCARCGQEGHADIECSASPRCANCSGSHAAYSKDCPEWQKQKDIVQLKVEKNISFSEAKAQVQQRMTSVVGAGAGARRPGMSYAAAVQSTRCASTQTELTWPPNVVLPVSTERTNASSTQTSQISTEELNSIKARDSYQAAGAIPKTAGSNIPKKQPNRNPPVSGTSRPGPASSKGKGKSTRESKGSLDSVKTFNRYGTLDDELDDRGDMDVSHPAKGSPPPSPRSANRKS